jgi:nucleoside 2-deoxyribosyltransferase
VFAENINQIKNCDVLVASTVGKDMGTLFECGAAYILGKPIIYFWESEGPLNLMLAGSAAYVARLC